MDILRPLTENEVYELFELYKIKYGERNFHFLLMYNQIKWNQQLRNLKIKDEDTSGDGDEWIAFRKTFYTHRDCDFRKYGTYVSLHWDIMQSVSFHSWEPELKELSECLKKTNLINWTHGPLLTNVDLSLCDLAKLIAESKGTSVQRARRCNGLILSHEKALNLNIPSLSAGFITKPLHREDADLIHSLWTNNKEGSLPYVRGLIQLNQTLGIYRETDNALVSWIFQNDFSGLGILQVLPEVQRKGFGSILASALSKNIAESELVEISAWTVSDNFNSIALLEKTGFEIVALNEWIQLRKIN